MKKKTARGIGIGILVVLLIGGAAGFYLYQKAFKTNTRIDEPISIYIPTGADFTTVMDSLKTNKVLQDQGAFRRVAKMMDYHNHVKPGRYIIEPGMGTREIVQKLRSANEPVRLVINKKRTKEDLAEYLDPQIEADADEILALLNDPAFLQQKGFTVDEAMAMFIPNTYFVYWNISAEELMNRMHQEFQKWWTEERKAKAEAVGLSPKEVIILASIVEEETSMNDEKAMVAGLYLNRLEKGMLLQADPTVKFALKDFAKKRVYFADTEVESPYNTYQNPGLPPGPIAIPSISSIEAVLNPEEHDYLFMSAREDFSGYHNFARTNAEHEQNAAKYHREINRRNIR